MSPYRVVEYDSGPEGGDEAVKNEWADKDYRLDQVARRSTYEWLLIFSSSAFTSAKGKSADEAYASEG
ncbi:hypothetical protein HR059_24575 (plasmid) [Sinorhizobium meliloti WSM1022]|uniref:hypothetical protein n=1 Tax=Rhizobium meliloti TaxID=382 RepID=UPI0002A56338|nr:hypothetical protein [Sinorhizobium meliloti]AGA11097.1 hypothetical protein C770_GR4pD0986 [Sinorhizobium meliloti GR4]QKN17627.1 hypothetical protein HR059_24575 [Sinorhizobium meliloti WSM1022]RVK95799.1 hypothetical protein CN151_27700 [Sinorhizobium meliloti]RVM93249.1 hypothetical protein CN119_15040 [Sinorhizobium meliloti]RVN12632.1 hypothetical protein CN112_06935 [Sinorhizobium meliloti]